MTVDNISDQEPKDAGLNAVSLYGSDGTEDFPVLKAFQCYIDAEQEKSRKRMLSLCIFFGCLMTVVIAVFVVMLLTISERNQKLNDRLVDFAMNRERAAGNGSAVVVQPPQDSAAILALTSKLDALQKKLADDQAKAEKAAADAAAKAEKAAAEAAAKAEQAAREAAKPKGPTAEQLEIQKLQALLSQEKKRRTAEKERQHQAELEEYRRKHYPELYRKVKKPKRPLHDEIADEDDETDDIQDVLDMVDERTARRYFDEENEGGSAKPTTGSRSGTSSGSATYSIPVDVKGSKLDLTYPME